MNARSRGPKMFLGVATTALALVLAQHDGALQSAVSVGGVQSVATATKVVTDREVSLSAANFFVPGTGNPGETGSTNPGNEVVIAYPATQPVTGDYRGSVQSGVAGLNAAVNATAPGSSVEVDGFSQGAHVANEWAAQPGAMNGRTVTLVTTGDPCTARTGILVRSPEAQAIAGPCSPLPPGTRQVVIVQACDPIANFPEKVDGLTLANALAGYTYCHGSGYGPDQLNRPDIYTYQDGPVTYKVIPGGTSSPLVQALHQNGIFLSADVEAGINAAVAQSGPGPQGGSGLAPVAAVHPVAASMDSPPALPAPDLPAQGEVLQDTWNTYVAEPLANAAQSLADIASAPADTSQWAPTPPPEPAVPTGNVAAAAEAAKQYVPAPAADWVASQVQASPLGGLVNNLPPLPFG